MTEENARCTLRLIAATTVLVGIILTTMTLLSLLPVSGLMGNGNGGTIQIAGTQAQMAFFGVLADLAIVAWGLAFYRLSPRLARRIVD
ncbi:MAG: hypothetical protein ACE5H3_11210 [Planctomycetota bacterium]